VEEEMPSSVAKRRARFCAEDQQVQRLLQLGEEGWQVSKECRGFLDTCDMMTDMLRLSPPPPFFFVIVALLSVTLFFFPSHDCVLSCLQVGIKSIILWGKGAGGGAKWH